MATQKQLEANRRNARRSTGPRTQAGKERARFNAIKHGLAAVSPVLPHENAAAFHEMRATLIQHYQPADIQELQLIDHIAHGQLRMERARRFENGMFDLQVRHVKITHKKTAAPRADDDTGIAACMCSSEFDLGYKVLFRYDSRAEASYFKAVNALHRLQQARRRQSARPSTAVEPARHPADSKTETPQLASFGQAAMPASEPMQHHTPEDAANGNAQRAGCGSPGNDALQHDFTIARPVEPEPIRQPADSTETGKLASFHQAASPPQPNSDNIPDQYWNRIRHCP